VSHRIIINSIVSNADVSSTEQTDEHVSTAEYSFTFAPSHHLTEQEENKRIAYLRRKLKAIADKVISNEPFAE
jgi:hypothetical protein